MSIISEIEVPPHLKIGDMLPVGAYLVFNKDQDPVLAVFIDDSDTIVHVRKWRSRLGIARPIRGLEINEEEDFKGRLRWEETPLGQPKEVSPSAGWLKLTDTDFLIR